MAVKGERIAWIALLAAWVILVIYLVDTRTERLCPPPDPIAVRLAQPKGATEVGVVYMDFQAARTARNGLDQWLHEHGHC